MWSGYLGFGLVQVPVNLFKATEDHDIGFHQYCPHCQERVGRQNVCKGEDGSGCGAVVEHGDILRGIEVDNQLVIVSDEELDSLGDELGRQIEILEFVDASEIDPVMFEASYYVGAPDGAKPYALLAASMAKTGLTAIARFTMRTKTKLAAIRVVEDRLYLHTLMWPDEVRSATDVPGTTAAYTAAELRAAVRVVKDKVGKFDPDAYVDRYQERLVELLDAKAAGEKWVTEPATQLDATVDDLLAKLEASVKRHPAGRKRAPAKKAPAKRTRRKVA
jgi:DNA end-binding protein Ku